MKDVSTLAAQASGYMCLSRGSPALNRDKISVVDMCVSESDSYIPSINYLSYLDLASRPWWGGDFRNLEARITLTWITPPTFLPPRPVWNPHTMPRDPLIGLVGKPSAGKSSTLNSLTDASSKVGSYPAYPSKRKPTRRRWAPALI